MKCQQLIILQVAAERVMSSIDFITSNSLFIYLCSSAQLCLCFLCSHSSLSVSVAGCRLRLMDTRRWNLPSCGRTELPSLRRTPLESSFSQCCQSAGAGQNLQAFSQTTWTGFKSSFISSRHVQFRQHQYVASEGTTSRFSFFFLFFFPFFYMQQETRQDVSQTGRGRLKDTVCATIRTRTIKKQPFSRWVLHCLCWLLYIYLHTLRLFICLFIKGGIYKFKVQGFGYTVPSGGSTLHSQPAWQVFG